MKESPPLQVRAFHGGVAGAVGTAVALTQSLLQVPLLLTFWAESEYGVWVSVNALLALLTCLDLGHQNYVGNEMARFWVRSPRRVQLLLASSTTMAVGVALLELLVAFGLYAWGILPELLAGSSPSPAGAVAAFWTYLIFWLAWGSVGGLLARLYPPAGLYARGQWLGVIQKLLGLASLGVACALGANLFGAMVSQVVAWTGFNFYLYCDVRRRFPDLWPWWRGGRLDLAWRSFRQSLLLTLNGLADQASSQGMVLMVSGFLQPLQAAVFATLRTGVNLVMQGSSALLQPLAPELMRYNSLREGLKIRQVLTASWMFSNSAVCLGVTMGLLFAEPAYRWWTRERFGFDAPLFSLLGGAVLLRNCASPLHTFLSCTNSLKSLLGLTVCRAVLSLLVGGLMLPILGLHGAGWAILAGEGGFCLAAWLAVKGKLLGLGAPFPQREAILAMAQVLAAGWPLWCLGFFREILPWAAGISTLLILGCSLVQWRSSTSDVRGRICRLFQPLLP